MPDLYHVVSYAGPFGFIKPWTAVRDGETFSQPFLTPSIVHGMTVKLGVSAILRHKLTHGGIERQQEQVQAAGWKAVRTDTGKALVRQTGVLTRGVMTAPTLTLAFATAEDAATAASDHLCLCRNEDLVFPTAAVSVFDGVDETDETPALIRTLAPDAFDRLVGFEMRFGDGLGAVPLGVSRYTGAMMHGRLEVVGDAARTPAR